MQPAPPLDAARAEASRLRIVAIDLYAFDIPLTAPFRISLGTVHVAGDVLVVVRTDAGLAGLGEACPFTPVTGETQASTLAAAKVLRERTLGGSPLSIETLAGELPVLFRSDPSAFAAFDTALHDLLGKVAGAPLYRLLGGDRTSFATDITADLDAPEVMAERAAAYVARGFDTIKIKVGEGRELDLARLRAIREAVGPERKLRVDANQGWTPAVAIDTLRDMAPLGVEFVEQPVAASDLEGLKAVHEAGPIPVMADEAVYGPEDARRLIDAGACAHFNIKLMKAGGVRRMIEIARLAGAAGMTCMVGAMIESRLAQSAAAHVVAACPNVAFADLDAHNPHAVDPIVGGMGFGRGRVTVPDLPGIGAEVDPGFLRSLPRL